MPLDPITAAASASLSQPIKDLYTLGKDKFGTYLSKWNNTKAIRSLEAKVAAFEKVKTIWQRDKYVRLTKFYYPSRVHFPDGVTKQISSLRNLPIRGGLVIEGTVGQGKSVFLRYLCIQELKTQASGRIPVFIELRKISSDRSIKKSVFDALAAYGFDINDELFEFYAESGKIVLLLDGFDELDADCVRDTIVQLDQWVERFPEQQIIVTSRPSDEIQKSSGFQVIKLAPLVPEDHGPFLNKLGMKGESLSLLLTAIQTSPTAIKEFLNTPLLLTLLLIVYQAESQIPSELPEFFKVLFVTVISKHDRTKPAYNRPRKSSLNDRQLESLFSAFCYSVMRNGYGVSLTNETLSKAFSEGQRYVPDKCDEEGFVFDITKVACLLLEDGFNYVFAHKSLLEYFSASFIKSSTEKQAQSIYSGLTNARRYTQWRATLGFLAHIDKYRYAKFFELPVLRATFDALHIAEFPVNRSAALVAINTLLRNTTIGLRKEADGKWRISSLAGFQLPTHYADALLHENFISWLFFIPEGATAIANSLIESNAALVASEGGFETISTSWDLIRENISPDTLDKILGLVAEYIDKLWQRESDYRQFIEHEDMLAEEMVPSDDLANYAMLEH